MATFSGMNTSIGSVNMFDLWPSFVAQSSVFTNTATTFQILLADGMGVRYTGTNFVYGIVNSQVRATNGTYSKIEIINTNGTVEASLTNFGNQPLGAIYNLGTNASVLQGADTVIGTDYTVTGRGDVLYSAAGNDTLSGGDGNDILDGGSGADTFNGGNQFDTVSYGSAASQIVLYLGAPSLNFGDAVGDTFNSIESFSGSVFNDYLYGSETGDDLRGNFGIDTIFGYGGNDTLIGGADYDYIVGGEGSDDIQGEAGTDILSGENGNDTISGGADFDQIYGGAGNDTLYGGEDGDQLYGGADDDELQGDLGNDYLYGEAGADRLYGGGGTDVLQGGDGSDILYGGSTNNGSLDLGFVNALYGGGGNDTLAGSLGIDYLWGGDGATDTGNDRFEFGSGSSGSVDVILDFQAGVGAGDVLAFYNFGYTSFAAMQAAGRLVQVGSYTGVFYNSMNATDVVYLANVNVGQLVADDFSFVFNY
jgi:Ca2+-binding RTX toxin-like protein